MNQETVVHHIGDGCYADERRIHAIHGLQLHPDVKPALYIHLNKGSRQEVKTGSRCSAAVGLQYVNERDWKITPEIDVYISLQLKTFKRNINSWSGVLTSQQYSYMEGAGAVYIIYGDSYPPRTGKEFFGSPLCFSHSQVIGPGKLFLFAACKRKKVYAEKQTRCVIFGKIAQHVLIA